MSNIEGLDYYIKPKKYKSINRPLFYLPTFLKDKTYQCERCSTTFSPDWLEKRTPLTPVQLKNGNWAMPITGYAPCSNCKNEVPIDLPKGSFGEDCYLFADEAYRDFGEQYLVNYSLVVVRKKHFIELKSIVSAWKQDICDLNGGSKIEVAHLTEIWGVNSRKKVKGAENLTKENIVSIYNDLAMKIAKNENIRLYSCSALLNKDQNSFRKQLQQFKEFVTFSLFSISMQETTRSGFIPRYFFENDGKMGWLSDMFERMKLTLMFPFLCDGKPVPLPKLIKKSAQEEMLPGIEVADALCFASARSAHNQYHEQPFDFDMSLLGNVAFIQFDVKGNVYLKRQIGYPGINA